MKNRKLSFLNYSFTLLILFICVAFTTDNITSLEIGKPIPKADVKMKDVSDKLVSLNEIVEDNGLLVIFLCNTCPYVKLSETRIKEVARLAKDHKIGIVIINSNEAKRDGEDSFDQMRAYAASQEFDFSYVVDKNSELADAFGATRTPQCFLFDKDGLAYSGAIDDNVKEEEAVEEHFLYDAILSVAAGNPVKVKTSKSIGCSIKRIEK